jgi:AraC-like DNA-binding protein
VPGALVRAPVEGISGVWKFAREPGGPHRARSLPGHLLHLVTAGAYRLRTNGREYAIRSGDVIYYHETEEVEWLGNAETVMFISVGFLAPGLAPLPLDRRVFRSSAAVRAAFARLYAASLMPRVTARAVAEHAALLDILRRIDGWADSGPPEPEGAARTWWEIENGLRARRQFRAGLTELCRLAHMSRATVVRVCRAATGTSPMRRLRDLRMAEAQGLMRFSSLNVGQVADYLGYPRIHEFSREFARYHGHPPSRV